MLINTLKSELLSLELFNTEASAISAWANAFRIYFEDAESNLIPISVPALGTPEAAMKGAMTGLSTAGASAIQAGIVAFWGSLTAAPATYFAAATVITPPPGLSGIATALQAIFDTNISSRASKEEAMAAIAGVIHPANLGGTATFPAIPPASIT